MVSRQAEENQELKYLHNWCKEVWKEIFSEKRHLAQRVEAEGGKSGPGGRKGIHWCAYYSEHNTHSGRDSQCFQSFHASPIFSGPEEIRMLGLASAPQESPDSEIVL